MPQTTTTAKAPVRLWCKKIAERTYQIECRSRQHAYHTVIQSLSTSKWICDRDCWAFSRTYTCPHIERVVEELRRGKALITSVSGGELFSGDEGDTAPSKPKQGITLESLFKDA
jgi:hypothetical protein